LGIYGKAPLWRWHQVMGERLPPLWTSNDQKTVIP
jgi:hypothetical protein